ncbi:hypothetical protein R1flu_017112 [Riccia fluitans]|uniref:Plastid lipid-associated protein/fibrillin conserved domain-containing protein n=1 Tax=Riccia fluitans TaxID=41844 RepID=A0ABD1YNT1_9MARC
MAAAATAVHLSGISCVRLGGGFSSSCEVQRRLKRNQIQLKHRGRSFRWQGDVTCQFDPDGAQQLQATSLQEVKSAIFQSLEGLNRGIFGVSAAKKKEIEDLLSNLESMNPAPRPTDDLTIVKGEWRLLYSTISILGVKRTKLGLRDFIQLGDFLQIIDVDQNVAINRIAFNVAGIGMLKGALTIEATYTVTSPTRVDIKYSTSDIAPKQLFSLFQKNYDLLLSIFNPEGWLEITYVDDSLRIGRDDKGNIFLVERVVTS